ncbi:hypothetical protein KAR91_41870 [Candidatus Pacearchaeota archaeon]|nr:hypothetical protein [Candidatus Pacearchaeota archaeon]
MISKEDDKEIENMELKPTVKSPALKDGLSCAKVKKEYILDVIDRKTGKVVQTETRKSERAFDRLWCQAMTNVNSLIYKLKAR